MRRITVNLDDKAVARLREVAEREHREPRQQASWIIERALRRQEAREEPEPRR